MTAVSHLSIQTDYASIDHAFPLVDAGHIPLGEKVLVQIRTARSKTKGGIHIIQDTKETEQWNTQVGKVIAVGPLAFRNRRDGTPWPEGQWVEVGEFVRVPKYGGDRWEVKLPDGDKALFVIVRDSDLSAKITDPTSVLTFV